MKKILTIGEILVEIVASSKGDGFLEAQPLTGPYPSGAPAIFIDQVGKLGAPCAIISRVGDDDFGTLNLRRLQQDGIDLAAYDFDTVFVDPPRAGIDAATLALIARYPRILYISCNPETLAANLHTLSQTHRIRACALFDQFPFTPHIESGVVLVRK